MGFASLLQEKNQMDQLPCELKVADIYKGIVRVGLLCP